MDVMLYSHGARAPDARPRDGQGAAAGLLNSLTLLASAIGGLALRRSWPTASAARARSCSRSSSTRSASGACGLSHDDRAARDLPLHPRPRHGRRVDDRRRADRRDLARRAPRQGARPDAVHVGDRRDDRGGRRRRSCCRASAGARCSSSACCPRCFVLWIRRDVPGVARCGCASSEQRVPGLAAPAAGARTCGATGCSRRP